MSDESSPLRITARLKLSAGVKPEVLTENLLRAGHPHKEVVEAVAAEVAARKAPAHKEFKLIHTRKSLLDRIVDGLVPILLGLAIMAAGIILSLLFSAATLGAGVIGIYFGIIALGFVITLYGLLASGGDA